ncbi:MAG: glycosyltransferase family 4 protein [Lachnospiraceae bacterium]|nr:glycosyltransferase family 4 protein [Lachnospiraceae bacterium]
MNVLLICGNDHYYGSAKAAINLLKYANEHCEDVRYIVLTQTKGAINDLCDGMGIENYVTGHAYACVAPEGGRLRNTVKHLAKKALVTAKNNRAVSRIEKLIDLNMIDVIHTNIDRDIIGCTLAQKYAIPHVMHLREFATGHYNVEPLFEGQYDEYNKLVDRYIAISRAVGQNWQEIGLDAEKIKVVYDGIDVERVQQRKGSAVEAAVEAAAVEENAAGESAAEVAAAPQPRKLRLVMCGDVSSLKGQDQAIRALALIKEASVRKNITLDVFGEVHSEKAYMGDMQRIIEGSGLTGNVVFRGYSSQLASLLKGYDCGIVCSRREGFGLATAEFMAAGLAVIASDTGANSELIEDGVSGLIYHYQDVADLSAKIETLYKDPGKLDSFGRSARNAVEEKFTIGVNCRGILDVYREVSEQL